MTWHRHMRPAFSKHSASLTDCECIHPQQSGTLLLEDYCLQDGETWCLFIFRRGVRVFIHPARTNGRPFSRVLPLAEKSNDLFLYPAGLVRTVLNKTFISLQPRSTALIQSLLSDLQT